MSLQSERSENFSEMTSFIGTDIGDLTGEIAEKPPRSSTHVVTVSWSWSPMHTRCSEYRIATDKKRESWHLYEISWVDSTQKFASARVASGTPYKGVERGDAARDLLKLAWTSEREHWDFDPIGFEVDASGLLTREDIDTIVLAIDQES